MLVNLKKASQLISQRPLPAPLDSLTDPNKRLSYLLALRRPLRRTNLEMKKGEELESPPPLPPGTIPDWLRIHVEAKTPEAILAALLVHTVELWSHQVGYADLPKDTLLNAICEVLGYRHNNSALFRLLYNPRYGIGWYDPAWGFSEEFTAHLQEKTGIKPD